MIKLTNITKKYKNGTNELVALNNVGLQIEDGDFIAIMGASVILADEPTGALDSATGQEIMELLKEINRDSGKTILLVTHDEKIASQANHIIRLEDGKIV